MKFKNKRVIITAAASGIGAAGVELFTAEGAHVVAVDRDAEALKTLAIKVQAAGGIIDTLTADLLDANQCRNIVESGVELMGGLDVLWAHAGMPGKRDFEDLDIEAYDRTMNLNVRAGLLSAGVAVKHLRETRGNILFTASIGGLKGGRFAGPIYSAAKFAVVGMTRTLALQLAEDGIRVNVVCPGPVETPMLPQFLNLDADSDQAKAAQEGMRAAVPLGRVGKPMEIAKAALWLTSEDASFVNGIALPVDGGLQA